MPTQDTLNTLAETAALSIWTDRTGTEWLAARLAWSDIDEALGTRPEAFPKPALHEVLTHDQLQDLYTNTTRHALGPLYGSLKSRIDPYAGSGVDADGEYVGILNLSRLAEDDPDQYATLAQYLKDTAGAPPTP